MYPQLRKADLRNKVQQFIKEFFPNYFEDEALIKP